MQIDFHYCTIRVICEKAGFSAEDAQLIAYASQQVDDAVEHEKMSVEGHLDILSHRFSGNIFDPICTAHKGLQYLNAFKEEVQEKIYIPFHFLPDLESSGGYIVTKNCKLSRKMVMHALIELSKSTGEFRVLNLIRLGIALHTFSDSWTHHGFSGRHNSTVNDIKKIELKINGKWEGISMLSQFEYNALPDIGHAEVGSFPDISHLTWRFTKESDGLTYERDNRELYLEAAENIFLIFQGLQDISVWNGIAIKLNECFAFETETMESKFKKFQKTFPEIGFYYDEKQWRSEALRLVERAKLTKVMNDKRASYILGSDMKWFFFHLAALDQRNLIMDLIEKRKGKSF